MRKQISGLASVMLMVAIPLELILIASQWNQLNRFHGHEVGAWGVRMGHNGSSAISWIVTVLVGVAFVIVWSDVRLVIMGAMIGAAFLVELLFVHILPRPQNRWDLALAFLLGALAMFVQAVCKTDFVNHARDRLQHVWTH